ncbi:transposase [bacterium]|nr:transposase [bacterium]
MNYHRVFIQNSYVHIIILSYDRSPIFIDNFELLQQAFENAKYYFDFDVVACCVLPDHIHFIMKPTNIEEYPRIITSIKYYFSRNYVGLESPTYNVNESSPLKIGYKNKREKGIFQHRYYEHTIVDENELNKIIDYIHYNPVKHGYVDKVKNWAYSSFKRFVDKGYYDEDWCDFSAVKDLNYE